MCLCLSNQMKLLLQFKGKTVASWHCYRDLKYNKCSQRSRWFSLPKCMLFTININAHHVDWHNSKIEWCREQMLIYSICVLFMFVCCYCFLFCILSSVVCQKKIDTFIWSQWQFSITTYFITATIKSSLLSLKIHSLLFMSVLPLVVQKTCRSISLNNFSTIEETTVCNVKGVAQLTKPERTVAQLCSSPQLFGRF